MHYRLEVLDSDGGIREALQLPAGVSPQQAAAALVLRVPTSMHPNDRIALTAEVAGALGKKGGPVIVVPDYVVACRLVEVKEAAE